MSKHPAVFLLQVADALVDEVARNTDVVLQKANQMSNREGFLDSLRGIMAGNALIGDLENNLAIAIKVCYAATQIDPQVKLDDNTTPRELYARALFQQGIITMGRNRSRDAIKHFQDSTKYVPDQATYFDMALCFLDVRQIEDAVSAFEQCIALDPGTEQAILAGIRLARLGRL